MMAKVEHSKEYQLELTKGICKLDIRKKVVTAKSIIWDLMADFQRKLSSHCHRMFRCRLEKIMTGLL